MTKTTKRLLGSLAVAAGAFGAVSAYLARKKNMGTREQIHRKHDADVWARPGMMVTFRAELMPGREPQERTFRVKELLPNGRVTLDGAIGEHAEREFMPLR